MIHVSYPFVLGYYLVEGFSLTQSSIDVLEDDGCSLMTYQGLSICDIVVYLCIFFAACCAYLLYLDDVMRAV